MYKPLDVTGPRKRTRHCIMSKFPSDILILQFCQQNSYESTTILTFIYNNCEITEETETLNPI